MGDLLRAGHLPGKLLEARRHYETICRGAGLAPTVDWDALALELAGFSDRLRPFIQDASLVLHRQISNGYSVLFEGAQATLLDVDHGSYPFVTSSTGVSGGATVGLGVSPTRIDGVIGIAKAYTTRVGGGPLPTEIGGALEEEVRGRGKEFGASTGRPRRCGWFDAVVVRYAARVNGFDTLALTKLDVLDELEEIKVCTGYRFEGDLLTEMPADMTVLEACQPVYESLPGWKAPTQGARSMAELPKAARGYVERLSEVVGTEIGIVSTGPDRGETILRPQSAVARWFD
jgi:adenylosuccinate synthase